MDTRCTPCTLFTMHRGNDFYTTMQKLWTSRFSGRYGLASMFTSTPDARMAHGSRKPSTVTTTVAPTAVLPSGADSVPQGDRNAADRPGTDGYVRAAVDGANGQSGPSDAVVSYAPTTRCGTDVVLWWCGTGDSRMNAQNDTPQEVTPQDVATLDKQSEAANGAAEDAQAEAIDLDGTAAEGTANGTANEAQALANGVAAAADGAKVSLSDARQAAMDAASADAKSALDAPVTDGTAYGPSGAVSEWIMSLANADALADNDADNADDGSLITHDAPAITDRSAEGVEAFMSFADKLLRHMVVSDGSFRNSIYQRLTPGRYKNLGRQVQYIEAAVLSHLAVRGLAIVEKNVYTGNVRPVDWHVRHDGTRRIGVVDVYRLNANLCRRPPAAPAGENEADQPI